MQKILQISLGHAHTLVLCAASNCFREANGCSTELFVFGSNHFGQLGTGNSDQAVDTKTNLPVRLEVGGGSLRLIHTKFFTNVRFYNE